MHRCLALALLVLSGCATPPRPEPQAPAPSARAAADAATPAQQPSSAPPPASGDMIFDAWASEFQGRALTAGVEPAVLAREMRGLTPDPRVASERRVS